jgi:hypothetical protein
MNTVKYFVSMRRQNLDYLDLRLEWYSRGFAVTTRSISYYDMVFALTIL